MRMPAGWTDEPANPTFTAVGGERAPRVLSGCVGALSRGLDIEASLVESQHAGGRTEWRGVFIAGTRLIYIAVVKNREGWSASSELQRGGDDDFKHDDLDAAWSVPLSTLSRIELLAPSVRRFRGRGDAQHDWEWRSQTRLFFDTEEQITLPLFGHVLSDEHEQRIEAFLDTLAH